MSRDKILTLAEIEQQFDSEWGLLANPETSEVQQVDRGQVLWHSPDRDEVYRKLRELRPADWAVLYTGRLPTDAVIVL